MKKKYLNDVLARLEQEVPTLRWIDADEGQLNFSDSRPPIAFPGCLVEITVPGCENMSVDPRGPQRIEVRFNLKVAFNDCASFNTKSPVVVRDKANERFDVLENIHTVLQGWRTEGCAKAFSRVSVVPEKRPDGLKVYNCVYSASFIDRPEPFGS